MTSSHKLKWQFLLLIFFVSLPRGQAQENEGVARIVVWQAKPGMARELEEGYKRHLEWHRKNNDSWTWHGWTIISGERFGYFIDGTFFHTWKDLDSPVSPAADAADNAVNVFSYGEIRSAAIYDAVPTLTNLTSKQLTSPLLTFSYFEIQPGRAAEFESLLGEALENSQKSSMPHAVLRPANGITEYLLLLPAEKQSNLGAQSEFTSQLLHSIAQNAKGTPVTHRFHTETARYRPDLSYIPIQK